MLYGHIELERWWGIQSYYEFGKSSLDTTGTNYYIMCANRVELSTAPDGRSCNWCRDCASPTCNIKRRGACSIFKHCVCEIALPLLTNSAKKGWKMERISANGNPSQDTDKLNKQPWLNLFALHPSSPSYLLLAKIFTGWYWRSISWRRGPNGVGFF